MECNTIPALQINLLHEEVRGCHVAVGQCDFFRGSTCAAVPFRVKVIFANEGVGLKVYGSASEWKGSREVPRVAKMWPIEVGVLGVRIGRVVCSGGSEGEDLISYFSREAVEER